MTGASNGSGASAPAPLNEREIVERIVRAAVRESPGPYRMNLAMQEWERIKAEQQQEELAAIARYHGQEVTT